MFVIHANLDAEATWAGRVLPLRVRQRISAMAPLLAALAPVPADEVEVWAPEPVDPARLRVFTPRMRVGTPPHADLTWADPSACDANDRRTGLAIAQQLGCALPGARVITQLADLDTDLPAGRWVVKAVHTASGRDRAHGEGSHAPTGELRARIANLLRTQPLVLEPWLDRVCDAGTAAGHTHGLATDARGQFAGIDTARDRLLPAERAQLLATAAAVTAALAGRGYHGPVGLDAFAYTDPAGERRFHPLCEINARHTFGAVARAVAHRLGPAATRLGFGPPPPHATLLIAPTPDDPLAAWVADSDAFPQGVPDVRA
jgi:hypothetical protein